MATTAAPTPVALSGGDIIPMYFALLSLAHQKCQVIPKSAQDVVDGCEKVTEAAQKYRSFMNELSAILPNSSEISDAHSITWNIPTPEAMEVSELQGGIKVLIKALAKYQQVLSGDDIHSSFFSEENRNALEQFAAATNPEQKRSRFWAHVSLATLTQTRLAREEMNLFEGHLYRLIIGSWIPQILILIFLAFQFALIKTRQRKVKKRAEREQRERLLLSRLISARRGGEDAIVELQ